jgi:hypothetical protein
MAIGKYYSGSTQIDIFDAAFAFDGEKGGLKGASLKKNFQERPQ